jgi:rhodanese-related sulfurtransferase
MTNRFSKPGNLFTRTLFLVLVGMLTGALFNALRPAHGIPWYEAWSQSLMVKAQQEGFPVLAAGEVREVAEDGWHQLLDARALSEYDEGHVPGALSLPFKEVAEVFPEVQLMLVPEQRLITYCSGNACEDALSLARFLRDQGYTNVAVFIGGMEAWREEETP